MSGNCKEEDIIFKVNEKVSNLFTRCVNLFYFYQVGNPFEQLNVHDYGFHTYEDYKNFLNHSAKALETKKLQSKHSEPYKDILKPIFTNREEFVVFDAFTQLSGTFEPLTEMKIKKSSVMGVVCRKLAKYLLKEYDDSVTEGKVSLKKEEIKVQILENIRVIMEKAKNHVRQSDIGLQNLET